MKQKKLKPKFFKINLHIYPYVVLVCIAKSDKTTHNLLKRWNVPEEEMEKDKGYVMSSSSEAYAVVYKSASVALLRLSRYPDSAYLQGILSHEIDHAVHDILKGVGMYRTNASEEAYTHLTAFITEQIYQKLKKKRSR